MNGFLPKVVLTLGKAHRRGGLDSETAHPSSAPLCSQLLLLLQRDTRIKVPELCDGCSTLTVSLRDGVGSDSVHELIDLRYKFVSWELSIE